jgi:hypothetical protein
MEFYLFWREYPRKVGRIKAERIWLKLGSGERTSAISGVRLWKQTVQWQSSDGMYIPYASTFLAQKRYLDEPWTGAFSETREAEP